MLASIVRTVGLHGTFKPFIRISNIVTPLNTKQILIIIYLNAYNIKIPRSVKCLMPSPCPVN